MNNTYQELVDKCKQAYKEKNMPLALKYWEEIYNITDKKLNEIDKRRLKISQEYQQFNDRETHNIDDYYKEKSYKKLLKENKFEQFDIWKEYGKYMEQFTDEEVYGITDYGKKKAYEKQAREDIFRDKDRILLSNIANEDLDILDDFCDMYGWCPIKNKDNTYNIVDTELNNMVEDEDYKTFNELVNRIVGRAIDYYKDEICWDEEDREEFVISGKKLYNIAVKYKNNTKWEEDWLLTFKKELETIEY